MPEYLSRESRTGLRARHPTWAPTNGAPPYWKAGADCGKRRHQGRSGLASAAASDRGQHDPPRPPRVARRAANTASLEMDSNRQVTAWHDLSNAKQKLVLGPGYALVGDGLNGRPAVRFEANRRYRWARCELSRAASASLLLPQAIRAAKVSGSGYSPLGTARRRTIIWPPVGP